VPLLNASLGRLLDLVLLPFRQLPPLAGLAVVSLLTAIGVLLVFRATSDQRRLQAVRRQLQATVFEVRLFHADPVAVFRALGEGLRHQAMYLRLTILPAACTLVLLTPVVAQLQSVYGYQGLQPGRPALVTAHLRPGFQPAPAGGAGVSLEVPAGIHVQTAGVWIPATHELVWRLVPAWPGAYVLHVRVGGERVSKTLDASAAVKRRSAVRPGRRVVQQLRYPAEPPLPAEGPLAAIRVSYPERRIAVLGWRVHWVLAYAVLSMVCALALRRRLGVVL
jgi:hypothetical protein